MWNEWFRMKVFMFLSCHPQHTKKRGRTGGAGARENRGREGYGRRERKGQEAGDLRGREAGEKCETLFF